MNKKTLHIIMSVVLGIAAFIIVSTVISLLFDAILSEDTITISSLSEEVNRVILYVKHSSIGVICIAVPMLVCYGLTYSAKSRKIFGIISVLLSLMLIAMCIGFIFDLRGSMLDNLDSTTATSYTIASAYFSELIKLIISCGFTCAYFTAVTIFAFLPLKPDAQAEPTESINTTVENDTISNEKGEQTDEKD